MRRMVIAIDGLTNTQRQRILAAAHEWAEVAFVPETTQNWDQVLSGTEIAFGWPPPRVLESSTVRFLQVPSSGCSQYLTDQLMTRPNFRLASARGVTSVAVAEHGLALMFALARRLPRHIRQQEGRHWERAAHYDVLSDTGVAIVGLGAVGNALAERCSALGMQVFAVRRRAGVAPPFVSQIYPFERLHDAISRAQHVVLALAAQAGTAPIFGSVEFNAMPRGSYFYNLARGSLIAEEALRAALESGHLAGAGLDVFNPEPLPSDHTLWNAPNLLITPHVGGRFEGEIEALVELFLSNLHRYRANQALKNLLVDN